MHWATWINKKEKKIPWRKKTLLSYASKIANGAPGLTSAKNLGREKTFEIGILWGDKFHLGIKWWKIKARPPLKLCLLAIP